VEAKRYFLSPHVRTLSTNQQRPAIRLQLGQDRSRKAATMFSLAVLVVGALSALVNGTSQQQILKEAKRYGNKRYFDIQVCFPFYFV